MRPPGALRHVRGSQPDLAMANNARNGKEEAEAAYNTPSPRGFSFFEPLTAQRRPEPLEVIPEENETKQPQRDVPIFNINPPSGAGITEVHSNGTGGAASLTAKYPHLTPHIPGILKDASSNQLKAWSRVASATDPSLNTDTVYKTLAALSAPQSAGDPAIARVQKVRASATVKAFSSDGPTTCTEVALQNLALKPRYGRDYENAMMARSTKPGAAGWSLKAIIESAVDDKFVFDPAFSLLILWSLYDRQIQFQVARDNLEEAFRMERDFKVLAFSVLMYGPLLDTNDLHRWLMEIWERSDVGSSSLSKIFNAELG